MPSNITIHKYTLETAFGVPQSLDMPRGAILLTCAAQHDQPRIWALVDLDVLVETRTFVVIGTGEDASEVAEAELCWGGEHEDLEFTASYIGTVLLDSGTRVLHVFEKATSDAEAK